ncbi:hypothetical protein D3C80_1698980 [compost metagenome]
MNSPTSSERKALVAYLQARRDVFPAGEAGAEYPCILTVQKLEQILAALKASPASQPDLFALQIPADLLADLRTRPERIRPANLRELIAPQPTATAAPGTAAAQATE